MGRFIGEFHEEVADMRWTLIVVLYVVLMAVVIIGVDFAFFRTRFWERLMANVGIVLVFAAFYLRFFKYHGG
jgi:cytochrome c oxidase subunit IV